MYRMENEALLMFSPEDPFSAKEETGVVNPGGLTTELGLKSSVIHTTIRYDKNTLVIKAYFS